MTVTVGDTIKRAFAIDVWFNVFRLSDGEGRDLIGTFDDLDKAVLFARNENSRTVIEVEYA